MINADEARNKACSLRAKAIETWWMKESEVIAKMIKERISQEDGKFDLELYASEYKWIDQSDYYEYATKQLRELGFDVQYYGGNYYEDGMDRSLRIKW